MARKSRIRYSGAVYHAIPRYRLYLILQYAVEKFLRRIHAFCLMNNHIHLVVQVE
ncbi:MAG: hypothetical protein PVSMB11_03570 [Desulfuromonadaceae bacterium]